MGASEVRDRVDSERLAEEQAALRRVATLVARSASPAQVFEAVAAEVARLLRADFSLVGRYEPDATLTHVASYPLELLSQLGARTVLDGDDLASVVQRSGQPASIDYDDAPGPVAALARKLGVRCAVGAPILVDDRVWGVMAAGWALPGKASSEAAGRATEFTELVATALVNSETRNEITRLAEEQAALRRVATLVARAAPPAETFEAVVTEIGQLFREANGAALSRFETGDELTMIGRWSRADGYVPVGTPYPLVKGTVGNLIFETNRPGRVEVDAEARGSLPAVIRELGWVSVVGAPILVEGRLWGLVAISSATDQSLPPVTEERLTEFTELVATAIANAESREAVARLTDEQAALLRVATLVAGGVEPEPLFDAIAGEVEALFGVDVSVVVRYEGDGTVTVMGANGGHNSPGARVQLDPDYVVAAVYRTRQAARFDLEDQEGEPPAVAREWGVRSALATPIVVEGDLWGAITIASLDSTLIAATERRLADFSALFATAIANMQAREQVTDLAEEQASLRRVATLAARESTPVEVLMAVAKETAWALGTEAVGMLRFEHDGSATLVAQSQTPWDPPPLGTRFTLEGENIVASVHRTGKASRMDDWANATGPVAAMANVFGVTSAVATPIVVEGRLWGTMVAATSQNKPLPPDTESRIEDFTELVATSIANAESRAELAASRLRLVATADATRRRIERDLHDGAQQQLVSLALALRAAQAALPSEFADQRAELSRVGQGITAVLDELREISSGIHPAILSEGGLAPALKTLARRSPIPVVLDVDVHGRLPESVEAAAYYVVAEMLTNAAKHAQASTVHVTGAQSEKALNLSVRDDGSGGADPTRGTGLMGLRDRVEALEGTITIHSPKGAGTAVQVVLPLVAAGGRSRSH